MQHYQAEFNKVLQSILLSLCSSLWFKTQTEDDEKKAPAASDSRTVDLAGGQAADKTLGFATNNIKTAKYNLITFFPIFLFEMFSRAAYLYFLAQVPQSAAVLCCQSYMHQVYCTCTDTQ